jgi:CheY-like chemotaxis protein
MAELAAGMARERSDSQGDLQSLLLIHRARLLGDLAGAIAHRFNNIMMAISSYAEVELKKATPPQKRSLEQVLGNIGQATSLVQNLLRLSRKHGSLLQPVSLNSVITGMSGLLQQLVGDTIKITPRLSPKSRPVNADYGEIEQLILSLTMNVRNSMAAPGEITISTKLVELDRKFLESDEEAGAGEYLMVSVSGAPATAVPQPKGPAPQEHGECTQTLDLAADRGLVKQAGGVMRISSSIQSESYQVYFPVMEQTTSPDAGPGFVPRSVPIAKTILVVEDDDAVRVPAAEFLKMEGFKVLQAKTGPEALHIVERHQGLLDLLVTDIIMPEMTGGQVAERLLQTYPGLRVLYMSGDSENASALNSQSAAQAVLQKPFRLNKLNEKIHDLLGQ